MTSQRVEKAFDKLNEGGIYNYNLEQALAKLVAAAEEHVECDPETIGNECVGLGGADGLIESLRELEQALKECGA